jgi:hypothetical protein
METACKKDFFEAGKKARELAQDVHLILEHWKRNANTASIKTECYPT